MLAMTLFYSQEHILPQIRKLLVLQSLSKGELTGNSGILINIYDGSVPNNGLKPYPIPGPSVLDCSA
jgi:hypothetical protein